MIFLLGISISHGNTSDVSNVFVFVVINLVLFVIAIMIYDTIRVFISSMVN